MPTTSAVQKRTGLPVPGRNRWPDQDTLETGRGTGIQIGTVPRFTISAEVVEASRCPAGHGLGQTFILEFTGLSVSRIRGDNVCAYALSRLVIPVALLNERLARTKNREGFRVSSQVKCPRPGKACGGGELIMKVVVEPVDGRYASRRPGTAPDGIGRGHNRRKALLRKKSG